MIGQAFWFWAKIGITDPQYAQAFTDSEEQEKLPNDSHESEEKPVAETKDEQLFDRKVLINRTRPEACDQEVHLDVTVEFIIFHNHIFHCK